MTPHRSLSPPANQSGAALLAFLLVFVTGASYVLLSELNAAVTQPYRDQQTARALAEAKAALIGYAASDGNRPGELPCPDINNDGNSSPPDDTDGSNCKKLLGWLPWVTLKLSDLRDGAGERLWYGVSNNYHANGSGPLNSETTGELTVDGNQDIVAVILAPQQPLQGQDNRGAGAQANQYDQYLESIITYPTKTYPTNYTSSKSDNYNDRLIAITRQELMAAVEKRVLSEARRVLQDYYIASNTTPQDRFYPYTAPLDYSQGQGCQQGSRAGFLPLTNGSCTSPNPALFPYLTLPSWFTNNRWQNFIYYTIADACTAENPGCDSGAFLKVGSIDNVHALLVSTGARITKEPFALSKGSAQTRPSSIPNDYLDSVENANEDDTYTRVGEPMTPSFNDQARIVAP